MFGSDVEECSARNCLLCSLLPTSGWDYVVLYSVVAVFRLDPYVVHHSTIWKAVLE